MPQLQGFDFLRSIDGKTRSQLTRDEIYSLVSMALTAGGKFVREAAQKRVDDLLGTQWNAGKWADFTQRHHRHKEDFADQLFSLKPQKEQKPSKTPSVAPQEQPWNPFNLPQTPAMGPYNPAPTAEDIRIAREKETAARGSQAPPPFSRQHAREDVGSSMKKQLFDLFGALNAAEPTNVSSNVAGPSGTSDAPPAPPAAPKVVPGKMISIMHSSLTPGQDRLRKMTPAELEKVNFVSLTPDEKDYFIEIGLFHGDNKREAVQKSFAKTYPNATFDWNLASKYNTNTADKGVKEFNKLLKTFTAANQQYQQQGTTQPGAPGVGPIKISEEDAKKTIDDLYAGQDIENKEYSKEAGKEESGKLSDEEIAEKAKRAHSAEGQSSYPGPNISLPFDIYEGRAGFKKYPGLLLAMPDDLLQGTEGVSNQTNRDLLRKVDQEKLGMNDADYARYTKAREKEVRSQWAYYRDMAPQAENDATASTVASHDLGEPAQGAGIWERLWHGYHGTIAGIPTMLALGAGRPLPSGTGDFRKDMQILRNIYTDAEIKELRDYTRKAFDVFMRNTTPVERDNLDQLKQRLPDLLDTVFKEVPEPQISANVPELPALPKISGPRLTTGRLPGQEPQFPPRTPLGERLAPGTPPAPRPSQAAGFGNIQLPASQMMMQDIARGLQQGAQQGLAAARQYGAEGLQALQQLEGFLPEATATPTGGPSHLLGGPVPGAGATQLSPEMQYRSRSPIATIEDVIEPDDIIDQSGPSVQLSDQKLHVPEQHEEDFYRWLSKENLIEELQLIYNRWAAGQGFNVMTFDDWLKSDMGRSNLENFYDEFLSSQYPTYPEGREAYMRNAEYNAAHPEVMDIEEQLARNPARFPAPYRVGQLPQVAPYEEQLPPAPLQPGPAPFQPTLPTPGPLYPQGLQGVLEEARQGFAERTIPMIAERFAGVGGGINSSAFRGSLLEAGRRFERDLAALTREKQLEEERFNLQRAQEEARRVEEQNRALAQREELGSRYGLQYGELAQRRAQTAREQQLAREREIQQRASQQQQLGLRGTELGGTLAERAARTEQARVGLLAETQRAREQAQSEVAQRFGGLGLQGAELGLRGQEAQAKAQLGRGALLSGTQQAGAQLGMTQAQIREQLRQGQVGQQLQQYGIHRGLPATQGPAKVEGNLGTAMGVGGGVANALATVAPFII